MYQMANMNRKVLFVIFAHVGEGSDTDDVHKRWNSDPQAEEPGR